MTSRASSQGSSRPCLRPRESIPASRRRCSRARSIMVAASPGFRSRGNSARVVATASGQPGRQRDRTPARSSGLRGNSHGYVSRSGVTWLVARWAQNPSRGVAKDFPRAGHTNVPMNETTRSWSDACCAGSARRSISSSTSTTRSCTASCSAACRTMPRGARRHGAGDVMPCPREPARLSRRGGAA